MDGAGSNNGQARVVHGNVGDRSTLLADLRRVYASGADPKLMILVELVGLPHLAEGYGTADDHVVAYVESRLSEALDRPVAYYRLREPEFCLIVDDCPVAERPSLLRALAGALAGEVDGHAVDGVFGIVRLPDEAADPLWALKLADERLTFEKGERGFAPNGLPIDARGVPPMPSFQVKGLDLKRDLGLSEPLAG